MGTRGHKCLLLAVFVVRTGVDIHTPNTRPANATIKEPEERERGQVSG
jgi:hypothetical protein